MTFKITPVNDYDAAYPRRRPRIPTAPAAPRFSLWRWLVTLVMGMFLSLYTAACDDSSDDDIQVDGDSSGDGDVSEYIEDDFWLDGVPDYTDGDLDDDFDDSVLDEYAGLAEVAWDYPDPDPEPEPEEETAIDDIDTWDMTDGDYHPTDPDPEMGPEEESDITDIDTWEQPDKPGPESDLEPLPEDEPEIDEEEYMIDGGIGLYRAEK